MDYYIINNIPIISNFYSLTFGITPATRVIQEFYIGNVKMEILPPSPGDTIATLQYDNLSYTYVYPAINFMLRPAVQAPSGENKRYIRQFLNDMSNNTSPFNLLRDRKCYLLIHAGNLQLMFGDTANSDTDPAPDIALHVYNYPIGAGSLSAPVIRTTIPCFGVDSEVLCLNTNFEEVYMPIKDMRKGTLVKSYKHGYRKVIKIGKSKVPFVNDPNNWMSCMYVCKKTDNMTGDLTLTGGHSILVGHKTEQQIELSKQMWGTGKIDDKYLLQTPLCENFSRVENNNMYDFYSLILENNNNVNERFGIWVNGVLVETSSENTFLSYENKLDLININFIFLI